VNPTSRPGPSDFGVSRVLSIESETGVPAQYGLLQFASIAAVTAGRAGRSFTDRPLVQSSRS
jgi:hypothetical protein